MRRRNPWVLLAAAWVPAVIFLGLNVATLVWLKSNTLGREGQLTAQVEALRAEVAELEATGREARHQFERVESIGQGLDAFDTDVFGDLSIRLPAILRAIGDACGNAGLRPDRYGYSAAPDRNTDLIRFSITFGLEGNYSQLRTLLAELQASSQMLSVTRVTFAGDQSFEGPTLSLRLQVETYFNQADPEAIRALVAGTHQADDAQGEPDTVVLQDPTVVQDPSAAAEANNG